MTDWREPLPERRDEDGRDERDDPGPRRPNMQDPEAQHAPGEDPTGNEPGEVPPPMRAGAGVIELDAEGIGYQPVGPDNIREGRVGGIMGASHAGRGQGQGG